MPWIKEVLVDAVFGCGLGVVKGVCGTSLFTESEVEEITNLKKLALSVVEKSPDLKTESVICDAIKNCQKSGLEAFAKSAPPEAVTASVVAAAELVCNKAFKQRFTEVLMGACLNIVDC
jgi:hypothetical protein